MFRFGFFPENTRGLIVYPSLRFAVATGSMSSGLPGGSSGRVGCGFFTGTFRSRVRVSTSGGGITFVFIVATSTASSACEVCKGCEVCKVCEGCEVCKGCEGCEACDACW